MTPTGRIFAAGRSLQREFAVHENGHWRLLPSPDLDTTARLSAFEVAGEARETLIVASDRDHLFSWSGERWLDLSPPADLDVTSIWALASRGPELYVATSSGMFSVEKMHWGNPISFPPEVNDLDLRGLHCGGPDADILVLGRTWLAKLKPTGKIAMMATDLDRPGQENRAFPRARSWPYPVLSDGQGGALMGFRMGVGHFNAIDGSVNLDPFPSEDDGAAVLFRDRDQNIWVACMRGLRRIPSLRFANYSSRELVGGATGMVEVSAITETREGELVEINPDPKLRASLVYEVQLQQVIMNLVVNANDSMLRGGQLELATTNLELTAEDLAGDSAEPGAYVAFTVTDTGEGIAESEVACIFDPFFSTKPVGKGTGLGLAMVHGIVHQAGGVVRVRSVLGQGARFEVLLPATSKKQPYEVPAVPPVHEPEASVSEAIFLCEDDRSVRVMTSRILTSHGYEVQAFAGPLEALEALADERVQLDLLITDVMMPEMGGRELASKALDLRPGLRVLFISGYAPESDGETSLNTELELLLKPYRPAELLHRVRLVLSGGDSAASAATTVEEHLQDLIARNPSQASSGARRSSSS